MLHPLLATARHRGLQSGRLPRISDPRMKSRLKLKHKGKQKAVPVPKEWQEQASDPWKGALSLPKPPPPPWGHLSGHNLPNSQDGHTWPHTLPPQWSPDIMTGFFPDTILIYSTHAPLLTTTTLSEGNYTLLREMQEILCGSLFLTGRKTHQKTVWRQWSPNTLFNNVPPPTESSY